MSPRHVNDAFAALGAVAEVALLRALCFSVGNVACLHAATVARGDQCLLLAGPSMAGKTTVAVALCCRGWRLVSDDASLVDLDAGEALPLARSILAREHLATGPLADCLDPSSAPVQLATGVESRVFLKACHIAPPGAYRITHVFLLGTFRDVPRLTPIGGTEGLFQLSRHSLTAPLQSARSRLASYLTGLGGRPWWYCDPGSPADTAAAISRAAAHVSAVAPGSPGL